MSLFDRIKKFQDGPQKVTVPEDVPFGIAEGAVKQAWEKSPTVAQERVQRKFDEVVAPKVEEFFTELPGKLDTFTRGYREVDPADLPDYAERAEEGRGEVFTPSAKPSLVFGSRIPADVPYGRTKSAEGFDDEYFGTMGDDPAETPAWGMPRIVEGAAERGVGTLQTAMAVPGAVFDAGGEVAEGIGEIGDAAKAEARRTGNPLAGLSAGVSELGKKLGLGSVDRVAKEESLYESIKEGAIRAPQEALEMGAGLLQLADAATAYDPDYNVRRTSKRIAQGVTEGGKAMVGSLAETLSDPIATIETAPLTGLLDIYGAKAMVPKGAVEATRAGATKLAEKGASALERSAAKTRELAAQFEDGAQQARSELSRVGRESLRAETELKVAQDRLRAAQADARSASFREVPAAVRDAQAAVAQAEEAAKAAAAPGGEALANVEYRLRGKAASDAAAATRKGKVAGVKEAAADLLRPQDSAALRAERARILDDATPTASGVVSGERIAEDAARKMATIREQAARLGVRRQKLTGDVARAEALRETASSELMRLTMDDADPSLIAAAQTKFDRTIAFRDAKRAELADVGSKLDDLDASASRLTGMDSTGTIPLRPTTPAPPPTPGLAATAVSKPSAAASAGRVPVAPITEQAAEVTSALRDALAAPRYNGKTAVQRIAEIDRKLAADKTLKTIGALVSRIPDYAFGGAAAAIVDAPSVAGFLTRRAIGLGKETPFGRWLTMAKTNRLPVEFRAVERELKGAARAQDIAIQEALLQIPESARPTVLDVMTAEAPTMADKIWEVFVGKDAPAVRWDSADQTFKPNRMLTGDETLKLEIANKYGRPLAVRLRELSDEAVARGLIKPSELAPSGFYLPERWRKGVDPKATMGDRKKLMSRDEQILKGRQFNPADDIAETVAELGYKVSMDRLMDGVAADKSLALTSNEFLGRKEIAKQVGGDAAVKRLDREWLRIPETAENSRFGNLQGKYVQADVWMELKNHFAVVDQLSESGFIQLLNLWKQGKTAWSPSTHARNVLTSALINAPAAGMSLLDPTNWRSYQDALVDLAAPTNKARLKMAEIDGVFDAGWRADLAGVKAEARRGLATAKSPAELLGTLLSGAYSTAKGSRGGVKGAANTAAGTANIAKGRLQFRNALEKSKEVLKTPGAIYGVEDDMFRLALYYSDLAKAAAREGVAVEKVSKAARQAAAERARKSYVDYENVPGFVQVLRAPFRPIGANGKEIGLGGAGWLMSQPFMAYSARAIPLFNEYLRAKPIQARMYLALHDYLTDANYAGTGRTEEMDKATLEASGAPATMVPARALGLEGAQPGGKVTGVDLGFLGALGKFAPSREQGELGSVRGPIEYLGDALSFTGPGPAQAALDIVRNRDNFTGQQILKGSDAGENLSQLGRFVAKQVLPPVAPGGNIDKLLSGEPDYQGRVPSESEQALGILGLKSRSTTPEDAVNTFMSGAGYELTFGGNSEFGSAQEAERVLSNWGDMRPEAQKRIAARWAETARPRMEKLLERLDVMGPEGGPLTPARRAAIRLSRVLRKEDPVDMLEQARKVFGKYRKEVGETKREQRKAADER